ncbi:hypothetical protein [Candidatus Symbiothrix dinenymphae]|uniref:hypothetical protein n=1 Tax=Candidatus Symbiothrix dinenymphae TaxID=467085 RepID=UPI000AA69583|nr:hypothetical protein [Candidatus Symbiothrix dinenymphae]
MAIPVRSIPVLEGEVAERFEQNARWAEEHRGSIDFSEQFVACREMIEKAVQKGTLKR